MLYFVVGLFCGGLIGMFIMCLVGAAKDGDNIGGDDDELD